MDHKSLHNVTAFEASARDGTYFASHILVGSYYIVVGLWWTWNILINYNISRMSDGRHSFRSHLFYIGPFNQRFPVESLVKVLIFIIMTITTALACTLPTLHCNSVIHFQHVLSYIVYLLSGIMELMVCCDWIHLPEDTDRASNVLAFTISGVMFVSHNGHASVLNRTLHSFFLPLTVLMAISLILEGCHRTNVMATLVRCFAATVIGTWFFQVAFILYPVFSWQGLPDDSMHSVMSVPTLFCFHLASVFVLFIGMTIFVTLRLRKHPSRSHVPLNGHCRETVTVEWHKNQPT